MPKKPVDNSEKLKRKFIQEQQKRIKPPECQKYIRIIIDEDVLHPEVGLSLLSRLTDATATHIIRKEKCKRIILWERNVGQQILTQSADNLLCNLNDKYELESHVLRIFSGKEFHASIEDKSIHEILTNIKSNFPGMKITLVVVGVLPKCTNQLDREISFADLQILYECSIQFENDPSRLSQIVLRYTRAVGEIPFKKQKSDVFAGSGQFLLNDNKDCVRVEGSIGLGRLWQQHLNRLPLVTLGVAQAILNEYPYPKKLLQEFEHNPDGPDILANLKISRGAMPMSSERRIGEVLSRKLFTLYNSMDPNEIL